MGAHFLRIHDLHVQTGDMEILKGLSLTVGQGEVHVIMGPNGAGKSTLANVLMGHPQYEITSGTIEFRGEVINGLKPHERAKAGLFLSFQYPEEIPGITMENFLRTAKSAVTGEQISLLDFHRELQQKMALLNMDGQYAARYLNMGFSGGEKKKSEILQMLVLEPKLAILDETDSGLDVDAVRIVSAGVQKFHTKDNSLIIITHHSRITEDLPVDRVHLLLDGRIVESGGPELVDQVEQYGFAALGS
ncbi:MAG TPA: Fe-S cluster assembly ATPase SufC [Firmicutes bacterium]|jgi:Fe-S cluster assembly ATP-binding protein|nr:Fe-S cluster assembly ATPase SufC [Bacillota bacterium]